MTRWSGPLWQEHRLSCDVGPHSDIRADRGIALETSFLFADWLGTPLWMWLGFLGLVIAILSFDLGVLHKENKEIGVAESVKLSALYIALGLSFGAWVWWYLGSESGLAYLTGFVVEKTLALDNVFVIALIFSFFAVPRLYQHRVLLFSASLFCVRS